MGSATSQLGVRTFIGSIGPVENVRMMVRSLRLPPFFPPCLPAHSSAAVRQMKSGHRACYMSRAFAQQHAFIPSDAAPGFYGFSGITDLGSWPIKVRARAHCAPFCLHSGFPPS